MFLPAVSCDDASRRQTCPSADRRDDKPIQFHSLSEQCGTAALDVHVRILAGGMVRYLACWLCVSVRVCERV